MTAGGQQCLVAYNASRTQRDAELLCRQTVTNGHGDTYVGVGLAEPSDLTRWEICKASFTRTHSLTLTCSITYSPSLTH